MSGVRAGGRCRLCRVDEVEPGGSRGFALDPGNALATIFVVRKGNGVFAYENRCPHTGVPMDWQPDRFLDLGGAFIICAVHGARFRIEDGFCVEGPCAGDALTPVAIEIDDDWIWLPGG